jgi:KaiC/GvpD/RAD55 family RecA-like ATPase
MLDQYVRDLLVTGTPHDLEELRYRFQAKLGIEVPPPPEPYRPADLVRPEAMQ